MKKKKKEKRKKQKEEKRIVFKERKFGAICISVKCLTCHVVLTILAMNRLTMYLSSGCLVQKPYPALGFFPSHNGKAKSKLFCFAGLCRKTSEMKCNSFMNGIP